jgi:hypothetical protein
MGTFVPFGMAVACNHYKFVIVTVFYSETAVTAHRAVSLPKLLCAVRWFQKRNRHLDQKLFKIPAGLLESSRSKYAVQVGSLIDFRGGGDGRGYRSMCKTRKTPQGPEMSMCSTSHCSIYTGSFHSRWALGARRTRGSELR